MNETRTRDEPIDVAAAGGAQRLVPDADPAAGARDPRRKTEEFRTWLFLSLIMAPILAVFIVSGYGFLVWMYQLFVGPPGS